MSNSHRCREDAYPSRSRLQELEYDLWNSACCREARCPGPSHRIRAYRSRLLRSGRREVRWLRVLESEIRGVCRPRGCRQVPYRNLPRFSEHRGVRPWMHSDANVLTIARSLDFLQTFCLPLWRPQESDSFHNKTMQLALFPVSLA